jgi:transcriptional regulator with XRE-family HTH domain
MVKLTPSRLARLKAGFSQHMVEAETGIHQSLLSLYEREIRTPPERHKKLLAELYGKGLDELWAEKASKGGGTCQKRRN